jgi:hypothetical protein
MLEHDLISKSCFIILINSQLTDEITSVPSPEDDDSVRTRTAIANIVKKYEPELLQIAQDLHFDVNNPDTFTRVIGHCYRQNLYQNFISGHLPDIPLDNFQDCIKQMQRLNTKSPTKMMHYQQISNYIGIIYRTEWMSMTKHLNNQIS